MVTVDNLDLMHSDSDEEATQKSANQKMRESFQAVNTFVRQATNQGENPELITAIKNAMKKGIDNEVLIQSLQRQVKANLKTIHTELGQIHTRDQTATQKIVRDEMYGQFQQNNIGITKRLDELKAFVKRQLSNASAGVPDATPQNSVVTATDFEEFKT